MYEYQFPRMKGTNDFSAEKDLKQVEKIAEEVEEVKQAENFFDYLMELFDVIHACETCIRMTTAHLDKVDGNGEEMRERAYEAVIAKNAERGYYANAEGWV